MIYHFDETAMGIDDKSMPIFFVKRVWKAAALEGAAAWGIVNIGLVHEYR
jgi:hypothetical protein